MNRALVVDGARILACHVYLPVTLLKFFRFLPLWEDPPVELEVVVSGENPANWELLLARRCARTGVRRSSSASSVGSSPVDLDFSGGQVCHNMHVIANIHAPSLPR